MLVGAVMPVKGHVAQSQPVPLAAGQRAINRPALGHQQVQGNIRRAHWHAGEKLQRVGQPDAPAGSAGEQTVVIPGAVAQPPAARIECQAGRQKDVHLGRVHFRQAGGRLEDAIRAGHQSVQIINGVQRQPPFAGHRARQHHAFTGQQRLRNQFTRCHLAPEGQVTTERAAGGHRRQVGHLLGDGRVRGHRDLRVHPVALGAQRGA
ncbi:MAG: hypothetical protein BWY76_01728 [bacterium ADurb.Bin429]|nr:MAG: hypothetical protein BWY76_01728 [bacterium ADurb.Bin429]